MLWHDHCNMFSQHASSHIDTIKGWLWWELMGFTLINDCPIYHTAMSTVTIMFYITTCTYLSYNWKLVLFDYFPKFLLPQPNPLWKPHIWFLLLCFFLFVLFLKILYTSEIIQLCLSLTYITQHSAFKVHPCYWKGQGFFFFMAEYI